MTTYLHIHNIDTPDELMFVIETVNIPHVGEHIRYNFDPLNPDKWDQTALSIGELYNGTEWLINKIVHEHNVYYNNRPATSLIHLYVTSLSV